MGTLLPTPLDLDAPIEESDDMESYELLKPADYVVRVKEADVGPSKKGDCTLLKLTFEVAQAKYKGRLLWDYIIQQHQKPSAVVMGKKRTKELCDAIGIHGVLRDAALLIGQTCIAAVSIEPEQLGYKPKNVIDSYHSQSEPHVSPAVNGVPVAFDDDDIPF